MPCPRTTGPAARASCTRRCWKTFRTCRSTRSTPAAHPSWWTRRARNTALWPSSRPMNSTPTHSRPKPKSTRTEIQMKRRPFLFSALATAAALSPALALALGRPIRLIVPYAPGGPIDVTARLMAERVKDSLGTVIIENKPGGGGKIGADAVAKDAPEGLTIGIAAVATHAINPWLFAKMPYDASKDFAPVTQMVRVPNVLVM